MMVAVKHTIIQHCCSSWRRRFPPLGKFTVNLVRSNKEKGKKLGVLIWVPCLFSSSSSRSQSPLAPVLSLPALKHSLNTLLAPGTPWLPSTSHCSLLVPAPGFFSPLSKFPARMIPLLSPWILTLYFPLTPAPEGTLWVGLYGDW